MSDGNQERNYWPICLGQFQESYNLYEKVYFITSGRGGTPFRMCTSMLTPKLLVLATRFILLHCKILIKF